MQSKPESFSNTYAEEFKSQKVVEAYRFRPPYPQEVFSILTSLIVDSPRTVLDVGAGSGDIARNLIEHVDTIDRIDAVDFSHNMIEQGKQLPHGDDPRLHWIFGKIEDAPLTPPYALITAGSSIHWPDWNIAFPRFQQILTPHGMLALIYRRVQSMPWEEDLRKVLAPFAGSRQGHRGANAVKELEARGFFRRVGAKQTEPIPFTQTIDDYIEGIHSRSTYSKERMTEQDATELDKQIRALLLVHYPDGILPLQVIGTIAWGKPESGNA